MFTPVNVFQSIHTFCKCEVKEDNQHKYVDYIQGKAIPFIKPLSHTEVDSRQS